MSNSTNPPNPPSPQLFFEIIGAHQKTGALKAAIELGLFAAIGKTPATAAEIAARCQCPERGIRILSDNLTIMGFLEKQVCITRSRHRPPFFWIQIRPPTWVQR